MNEKFLSSREWTKFSQTLGLPTNSLGSALEALEKASGPAQALNALDDIDKQAAKLKGRRDKGLEPWLKSMAQACASRRRTHEEASRAEEEEADSPIAKAMEPKSMLALLKQARQGVAIHVLVARVGRSAAVLMSRRSIPSSRRTPLGKHLNQGKATFYAGVCVYEGTVLTFLLDQEPSGLAKALSMTLSAQLGRRMKVSVKGPSGAAEVAEDDESGAYDANNEDDEDNEDDEHETQASAAAAPAAATPAAAKQSTGLQRQLSERLATLKPQLQTVQAAGGEAAAQALRLLGQVQQLAVQGALPEALLEVAALETALLAPPPGADDVAAARTELKAAFERMRASLLPAVGAGMNDADWYEPQSKPVKILRERILEMYEPKDTATPQEMRQAIADMQQMLPAAIALGRKRDALDDFRRKQLPAVQQILLSTGALGPQSTVAHAELQAALARVEPPTPLANTTPEETERLIAEVLAARKTLLRVRTLDLSRPGRDSTPASLRATLVADPLLMAQMAEVPEGRALLDGLVANLGRTARGKEQNAFVRQALDVRYQASFIGDLDQSAGLRMYRVFGMVPESHVRENAMIATVKRNKNFKAESFYAPGGSPEDGVGRRAIVINGVRTGGIKGWANDTLGSHGDDAMHGLAVFDRVVLHEIGHGVDEKLGFMNSQGEQSQHGGWREHTRGEVAELLGEGTGFFDAFMPTPRPVLLAYLDAALQKGFDAAAFRERSRMADAIRPEDLVKDPGVKQAEEWTRDPRFYRASDDERQRVLRQALKSVLLSGQPGKLARQVVETMVAGRKMQEVLDEAFSMQAGPDTRWNDMGRHQAVQICRKLFVKGSNGVWDLGDAASKLAVGGRVYQESYEGKWCSYEFAARGIRVSNYQFRSAAEWFAESYAAFHLQRLPTSHPLSPVLQAQVEMTA